MIHLSINVRIPGSNLFHNFRTWSWKTPFEHKFVELQLMRTPDLLELSLNVTFKEPHAGTRLTIGILTYQVELTFYDSRH